VQPLAGLHGKVDGDIAFAAFDAGAHALFVEAFNDRGVEDIDLADKAGDEQVFRLFVDLARVPSCSILPSRITTMRSDMVRASS
jgi:hypothetical protein